MLLLVVGLGPGEGRTYRDAQVNKGSCTDETISIVAILFR